LASGSYLTFILAADDRADWAASSGLRFEFHKRNLQVCSVFGCAVVDYPKDWKVEFQSPGIGAMVGGLGTDPAWNHSGRSRAGLLIGWALRASVFFWVVRLIAFFNDRDLKLAGSWRLAAATAMPGALLLTAGILLYGLGALDLIHLLILAVLRLVLGSVYLIVCR